MFSSKGSMLAVTINILDEHGDRLKGTVINIEQVSKRFSIWVYSRKDNSWQSALSNKCLFGTDYFCQLILLFNFFLLLFMSLTALFVIIHRSHCIILANFYLYLQYFQQKSFHFQQNKQSQYTYGVEYESYGP